MSLAAKILSRRAVRVAIEWLAALALFAGLSRAAVSAIAPQAARLYLPVISRAEGFRTEPVGRFDFVTTIAGDPNGRLLVGERTGHIWSVAPTGEKSLFLDLSDRVTTNDVEQGLLDLTIDPAFNRNGFLYVFFTGKLDMPNQILVSRFRLDAGSQSVDPAGEVVLLSVTTEREIHNGGGLAFGPDGMLYVAIGDGWEPDSSQNPGTVRGKILRLAVDRTEAVDHSPLHPWLDAMIRVDGDIFAAGLRNPWRISFDRITGGLFIADVGYHQWEEINIAPAGQTGLNFGWPCREGTTNLSLAGVCAATNFVAPVHAYAHSGERCAIIGGAPDQLPGAIDDARYIFGDFCSREVMTLQKTDGVWQAIVLGRIPDFMLTTFGLDAAGTLFAGTTGADEPIYRLALPPPVGRGSP